jgi:probable phosphoglycerate mutase
MTRTLFLVRHGEHLDAEHGVPDGGLSKRGVRQAHAIAKLLKTIEFDAAWYSPAQRAAETMAAIESSIPNLDAQPSSLLLDCVPTGFVEGAPEAYEPFFGAYSEAEFDAGRAQMADAVSEFLGTGRSGKELIVTHNFVIAWFVREVMFSPDWRWLGINQANCGLTVLHQIPGRPWTLRVHNDLGHLPESLRTGLPAESVY